MAEKPKVWITARLEDGDVTAAVHVLQPFGAEGNGAVVHVDVPEDARKKLVAALRDAMAEAVDDATERAEEAGLLHRIRMRELGEDFKTSPEYSGPVVTVEDAVYSDPALMELPARDRAEAIERGLFARGRKEE